MKPLFIPPTQRRLVAFGFGYYKTMGHYRIGNKHWEIHQQPVTRPFCWGLAAENLHIGKKDKTRAAATPRLSKSRLQLSHQ